MQQPHYAPRITETDLTDEDIQRIVDNERIKPTPDNDKPSNTVMAAFRRAKKASIAQDARSRQNVAELLQRRDSDAPKERVLVTPKVPCGQTMLTDYAAVGTSPTLL